MGMRQTTAIEELLRSRKQRQDNPFGGDRARALASALSGMSASAGTYGGKMPQSPGFQEGLKLLGRDEDTTDEQLFENIKVAGLADEAQKNEARRARVLDPLSRGLLESRIKALPIEQVGEIDIRPDMTMGEVEDDPILGQFMKESLPKRPTVTEDIARTKEAERQARRRQPLSDIDRKFLEKKMKEFGIDKKIPAGYTRGDAEDNMFFEQYIGKMPSDKAGLTPYQQIMIQERRLDRGERRADKQEQRAIEAEKRKKPDDKFQQQMLDYDEALALLDTIEKQKQQFPTGRTESIGESMSELATDYLGDIPVIGKYAPKPTPGFAEFRANVERNLAQFIKRISGAAASNQEVARLGNVEVKVSDPDSVFMDKIRATKDNLMAARDIAIEHQRRLGKDPEAFVPMIQRPGKQTAPNRGPTGELQERLTEEDKAAADWAHKNPDDPRSKQILEAIRAKFRP